MPTAVPYEPQGNAYISTKKGFCYLTIKWNKTAYHLLRIRQYTITPEEKRRLRRRYPQVTFDWQKLTQQLAEKRAVCRRYRARRRTPTVRVREPFYGVVNPRSRTVVVNDPTNIAGVSALLDAVLEEDRRKP